jgi:hypothetical protein
MKTFFWKDKTGRGYTSTLTETDLLEMENEHDWNDEPLHDFATEANPGDVWQDSSQIFTCIETINH